MTVTDQQFKRLRREGRVAYALMGVALAAALWLGFTERQARLESVANTAARVIVIRCERTNRVGNVVADALRAQRSLAVRRHAQGNLSTEDLRVSLLALDRAIVGLVPQDCQAQARRVSDAAKQ